MEYVQKQQTIHYAEVSVPRNTRISVPLRQVETNDKEAAKLRKRLASEAAIRQLESRKALGMIATHRLSFNR
jgi:hypothetical protein